MKPQVRPLLKNKIPSLSWEIQLEKPPLENLQAALQKIQELQKKLRLSHITPEEHLKTQRKLLRSLKESGLTLAGTDLLQLVLKKKRFKTLSRQLTTLSLPTLTSSLLSLYAKNRGIKERAAQFPGAELEIEADQAAILSLYQIEVHKRTRKPQTN